MVSFQPVRAILRGLEVLRVVSEEGPLTASEIARKCSLPQASTVRMLETLIEAGYVFRHPSQQIFGVTARTKSLSRGYDARSRLIQIAEPVIEELRHKIGWPSNLAVQEGGSMVIAYTNRASNAMSIPGRLGAAIPILATGVGVAYLAAVPEAERSRILALLRASQERWDLEPELWERLDQRLLEAGDLGYAFAEQIYLDAVYQSRIWAVATAIKVNGQAVAAISSLILYHAGERDSQLQRVLPALREAAERIGHLLEMETLPKPVSGDDD